MYINCTKYNSGYISKLQDNGFLQDGLYRYRYCWKTQIGCTIFDRGDRKECRKKCFKKLIFPGEIVYKEQVWSKEDLGWNPVTEFKYHPDTFSWEKMEIDLWK